MSQTTEHVLSVVERTKQALLDNAHNIPARVRSQRLYLDGLLTVNNFDGSAKPVFNAVADEMESQLRYICQEAENLAAEADTGHKKITEADHTLAQSIGVIRGALNPT